MQQTLAKDIMSTNLVCTRPETTVEEALKLLLNHRITGIPVTSAEGKLLGIVSEYDLLDQLADEKTVNSQTFQKKIHYSKSPLTITTELNLTEIVKVFVKNKVRRLPVVDASEKLVGLISRRDLMRVFYYRAQFGESG